MPHGVYRLFYMLMVKSYQYFVWKAQMLLLLNIWSTY